MKTCLLLPAIFPRASRAALRLICLAIALALAPLLVHAAEKKLIVHEWGTFTSLQDEAGNPIGGINTDDEPVPKFVQRLAYGLLLSPSEAPPVFFQGAPRCHPDVTMRLETPVLYFYPPAGPTLEPFDVQVAFRGGWLTEFYPPAEACAPGFDLAHPDRVFPIDNLQPIDGYGGNVGQLQRGNSGQLWWKGIKLGVAGLGPETQEKVWLAPRAVPSAMLQTAHGECEKFLFYRGVGSAAAGLRVIRDEARQTLEFRYAEPISANGPVPEIRQSWLVDIQPDGRCAFRALRPITSESRASVTTPSAFGEGDFSERNLAWLEEQMRAALVSAGLFPEEAEALLRTWQLSYFQSPGLRLFYLCPPAEADRLLPLKISIPCDITRVMIGRIEIVTPEQRALLARIAAGPSEELWKMRGVTADSQSDFFKNPDNLRRWNDVMSGKLPYKELGLPIPPIYANYLALGRFRNALLLDEAQRRPTAALTEFIKTNRFDAYRPGRSD